MQASRSLVALAVSLLVHAALALAIISRLAERPARPPEPPPLRVNLLPPPPPAPERLSANPVPPTPEPAPAPPAPPPRPERKKPRPAARPVKPAPTRPAPPQQQQAAPPPVPEPAPAPLPAPSPPSAPQAAPAAPSAPPAPAAPARTSVSIPASYAASNRKPPYPPLSKRYGEQGTVRLRVLVKADGTAGTVQIERSSGYPLLDTSARTAVETWRFNPATVNGKAVDDWFIVPFTFTLQE